MCVSMPTILVGCVVSNKYIVTYFQFLWFFCCPAFPVPVSGFPYFIQVMCYYHVEFRHHSKLIMLSFVPEYLGLSDSNSVCFTAASRPNMRKNGATADDSMGKNCIVESFYSAIVLW